MGHTNQTTNYELSQFLGSDKPAWLVDYNGDNVKIDTAMKAISDVADAAKTKADINEGNITTVTSTANTAEAKASSAISNTADSYDATSTYALGDLVIYNNLLYKCTTAINVPETFDGTHWTRTTLEELRENIESEITAITSELTNRSTTVNLCESGDEGWVTKNLPSGVTVSEFKYIRLSFRDASGNEFQSSMIPLDIFKAHNAAYLHVGVNYVDQSSVSIYGYAYYNNETQIAINHHGATYVTRVEGIR